MRLQELVFLAAPLSVVGLWTINGNFGGGPRPIDRQIELGPQIQLATGNDIVERPAMMSGPQRLHTDHQLASSSQVESNDSLEYLGPNFRVDQLWRSMEGPSEIEPVFLADKSAEELVWITGCHVEMVGADGYTPQPADFMCHVNIDIDVDEHRTIFDQDKVLDGRIFTLSQGQLSVEFPNGFGIPVRSDEAIEVATQVLNLNLPDVDEEVRHRVHIDYVRDDDTESEMVPLFESGMFAMKALDDVGIYDCPTDELDPTIEGAVCLPGKMANDWDFDEDSHGRRFTGHWVVEPGREVNHTRVTTLMAIDEDTTIHFISVHLHPFAESIELRDLTTNQVLFRSEATNHQDRVGLANVTTFSSAEGIPVYVEHEYELVSVYNNTSSVDQDSMAVLYLYMADQEFLRHTIETARLAAR